MRRPTTPPPTSRPSVRAAESGRGFTLIEVLIVVVILGILAAIAVPQFSSATTNARESTVREDLRYLRTQVSAFKYQHREVLPGFPGGDPAAAPTAAAFLDQMTKFTDEACGVGPAATAAYRYGPYLTRMPANPMNGKDGVWVVTGDQMPAADAARPYGWIYNPVLGKVQVNLPGVDAAGNAYAGY